jgi:hypothetical protein
MDPRLGWLAVVVLLVFAAALLTTLLHHPVAAVRHRMQTFVQTFMIKHSRKNGLKHRSVAQDEEALEKKKLRTGLIGQINCGNLELMDIRVNRCRYIRLRPQSASRVLVSGEEGGRKPEVTWERQSNHNRINHQPQIAPFVTYCLHAQPSKTPHPPSGPQN